MTNYEKLSSQTIENMSKDRTKCVSYSFGYTYKNDAGTFEPKNMGDDPYIEALMAEIEWLRKESD